MIIIVRLTTQRCLCCILQQDPDVVARTLLLATEQAVPKFEYMAGYGSSATWYAPKCFSPSLVVLAAQFH